MRTLIPRPKLSEATLKKLAKKTQQILKAADKKAEADSVYASSRTTAWFAPIITELSKIAGAGQHCFFCSGGEASQVEHFKPKAIFPADSMTWENFTWSCALCNQYKSAKFESDPETAFINPLEENVWTYFLLDQFGNLSPRWIVEENRLHPRAVETEAALHLRRQAMQERRQARHASLAQHVRDSLTLFKLKEIDKPELLKRYKAWKVEALQPDVADYFLGGPGRDKAPFNELLAILADSI